jgi:hypothetical protein
VRDVRDGVRARLGRVSSSSTVEEGISRVHEAGAQ